MPAARRLPASTTLPFAAAAFALAAGLGAARPAAAYKQYRTEAGCGVRWYSPAGKTGPGLNTTPIDIHFAIGQGGAEFVVETELVSAVREAFMTWEEVPCTVCASPVGPGCAPVGCAPHPLGVSFHFDGVLPGPVVGACAPGPPPCPCPGQPCGCRFDAAIQQCTTEPVAPNGNFLVFVREAGDWSYGSSVLALTVLTYSKEDGRVADADILFNDAGFDFCAETCTGSQNRLCNTVTHEIGHFLGMDHSTEAESTMYFSAPAGEVKKCSLHQDDRVGVCGAYRTACSAQGCPAPGDDDGCSAMPVQPAATGAGRFATGALGLLLIGIAWQGLRFRARRP